MSGASESVSGGGRISIGDLIALNDEITSLSRAGLPLERGLGAVGRDLRGTLGAAMGRLSKRMESGQSLDEALRAESDQFPPVYCAVVEAGLRAGRLPAALENLAGFIRSYEDSRRSIGLAIWYPLVVLILAYVLFLLVLENVIPRLISTFDSLEIPRTATLRSLDWLSNHILYWGPILPALLLAFAVAWTLSGRAANFQVRGVGSPVRWFPWMRSLLAQLEAANFAQLLGILVEHHVPYPEAIRLAAQSSGDPALARAAASLASASEQGQVDFRSQPISSKLQPLLRWILASGYGQASLSVALRQIAAIYRKRATQQAEKLRILLPMVTLIGIGMTATLLYGLVLFVPLASLLRGLTRP
ncbi:type II secretion system F family protein [Singulisphaera sp. PoT]|uniref:type II secretion system F family protein n=1 Tax=Singulisphaera sp. PoT TaxID=3411797 RepID=UPI003BF5960E